MGKRKRRGQGGGVQSAPLGDQPALTGQGRRGRRLGQATGVRGRRGQGRQGAKRDITVAGVVTNVEKVIRRQSAILQRMIYANARGYTASQILAAMGYKAQYVISMLSDADIVHGGSGSGH